MFVYINIDILTPVVVFLFRSATYSRDNCIITVAVIHQPIKIDNIPQQ